MFDTSSATPRKGWKTIRIFVSFTLLDFQVERKLLERDVFPLLRSWCQKLKLRMIDCDLELQNTGGENFQISLDELGRCLEDKTAPLFLHISPELVENTTGESTFLYCIAEQCRNLLNIPDSDSENFQIIQSYLKLNTFFVTVGGSVSADNEKSRFSECDNKFVTNNLLGEQTTKAILDFFQTRIGHNYPLDNAPCDVMQVQKEAHSTFLDSRSSCVLGRDKLLNQIENFIINGSTKNAPLLVVGIAGAGKSALMARCAHNATQLSEQNKIKFSESDSKKVKIFYHFVGATPRSTDLASFLQRLTKEIKSDSMETQTSLDELVNLAYNLLESPSTDPIVIVIDAINQMDADKHMYLKRWIPEKISPNVRLVISTIEGTVSHQTIRSFKSSPTEIICGPLDVESSTALITNILNKYNQTLGFDEMKVLLNKQGSRYPLWLTLACEEIRVCEERDNLREKIDELPDDLISLEETVFGRFERETGGNLMKACVCLLEVSRHGLLETELLSLLSDEQIITMPEYKGEPEIQFSPEQTAEVTDIRENISKQVQDTYLNDSQADSANSSSQHEMKSTEAKGKTKKRHFKQLPWRDWSVLYKKLKRLLRPCGDIGEGRLDFYHRSLSKAVRKKYFSGETGEQNHKYNFWHGVLADFFEGVDNMDRKAEELPYHLEKLLDNNRLISCLMDWEIFDRMYNEEFSVDLLHSWRQCGGYGIANAVYHEQLANLRSPDTMPLVEYVELVEKVYGFLVQAGQYSHALELMEERLRDEKEKLNERPEKMADIYQNMARCKSEVDKAEQFVDPAQLDDNHLIVDYGRKCLQYRKQMVQDEANEYRCALVNILIAHHLSNVADLTRETQPREESFAAIEEAMQVFRKLGDIGHIAECLMTKAIIDYSMPFPQREKLLLDSLDLCLKGYGENHLLTTRIYLNTGIAYSMARDWRTAFDFFIKLKRVCLNIFGPNHPKTQRAVNTLNEPRFLRMAAERERYVPDIA